MKQNPNNKPIRIVWEHLQDPDSEKLVRQAVELILEEIERESASEDFDKSATLGHAEGVPIENNDKSILTKS
jgi:hypothetical protein